jgi:hypothetical protein
MNHKIFAFVVALVVALIVALIMNFLGGLFTTIMQPDVVYEELPVYLIGETNDTYIKSVSCVLLKNTGYDTASDVKFEITSTDFYLNYNEMWPEIMKDFCDIDESDPYRPTYSFKKFAPDAFVWISISAPCRNPELHMDGRYDGGEIIEKEKGTTPIGASVIGFGSFLSGFFTYFAGIRFLRMYHKGKKCNNKDKEEP